MHGNKIKYLLFVVIDRYWFFITDTDYLHVYVPDNRYAEPIFIKYINNRVKSILLFQSLNNNKLLKMNSFMLNLIFKLQQ